MKGDEEVLVMIGMFFGGVALKTVLDDQSAAWIFNALVAPVATLAAAYVGARAAFDYQMRAKVDVETSKNLASLNLAIFELSRTANLFRSTEIQFIAPFRSNEDRELLIQPAAPFSFEPPKFDFSGLSFLLASKDPNALGQLAVLERSAASAIGAISHRTQLHFDHLQPAVERLHNKSGQMITFDEIRQELGPRRATQLKGATTMMIDAVDQVATETQTMGNRLTLIGQQLFPEHNVISFSFQQ